jgi:lactocepin
MNLANAVDIIILSDVSRQAVSLGNDYIIVISNDKGFDRVIDEINIKNDFKRISRRGTINAPIKIANEKLKPALTETSSKVPESKTDVKTDAKTETKSESKTETKTGSKTPEKSPEKNTAAAAKKTTAKVDMEAVKKLFGGPLSKYNVSKSDIMNIIKDTKTRCEINNKISKTYHNTDLKNIMTALKPLIKDLPGK